MRTLRLSLVGTVILVLLGGLGGAVLAVEDSAAFVTGSVNCKPTDAYASRASDAGELHQIGGRCTMEMSDARVSGFWVSSLQTACFKEAGDACLSGGTAELVPGPDGRWIGTWGSLPEDQGPMGCFRSFPQAIECDATLTAPPEWATLEGTGIYEGWSYWFHTPDRDVPDAVSGLIFEGPPPPWKTSLPLESIE